MLLRFLVLVDRSTTFPAYALLTVCDTFGSTVLTFFIIVTLLFYSTLSYS